MNPDILEYLKDGARQIFDECDRLADGLQYVMDLAVDINDDLKLGYERDSDSFGVLYKAAEDAVREAFGR